MAIENAVWAVTEALAPDAERQGMGWHWGDVVALNGDGTMTVTIQGVDVDSIITTAAVTGVAAGDRVLVVYLGSEAVGMATTAEDEYPLTTLGGTGTNQFYAHNRTATLMASGTTPSAQWGSQTLCTIPAGYRPKMTLYFPVAKTGAAISDSYVQVNTDGSVVLQNWGGTQAAREYRTTCSWAY